MFISVRVPQTILLVVKKSGLNWYTIGAIPKLGFINGSPTKVIIAGGVVGVQGPWCIFLALPQDRTLLGTGFR